MLKTFGILNYKSVRDSIAWVQKPGKVNVLIGQNNAGKTNILKYIAQISDYSKVSPSKEDPRFEAPYGAEDKDTYMTIPLNDEYGAPVFDDWNPYLVLNREGLGLSKRGEHFAVLREGPPRYFNELYKRVMNRVPQENEENAAVVMADQWHRRIIKELAPVTKSPALYIPVDRGIARETTVPGVKTVFSGKSVQEIIETTKNPPVTHNPKQTLGVYRRIKKAVAQMFPDLDLDIGISSGKELFFDMKYVRLKYSHYGYGIQQILLMCCAIEHHDNGIVCIDEPENGLHPTLQRRFLKYLVSNNKDDRQVFLATQSPVFADMQSGCSLFHTYVKANGTMLNGIIENVHARDMLDDIGVRASDILQANGAIWVEGPSDKILLKKWISLVRPDWAEGIHYSIVFYGGSNLAHYTGEDEVEDLIEILKINRKSFVVMDRDRNNGTEGLKPHVERIIRELGDMNTWVTGGREIENYIPKELIIDYLKTLKGNWELMSDLKQYDSLASMCNNGEARIGKDFELNKVRLAHHAVEHMTEAHLDVHDLTEQLNRLVARIDEWNQGLEPHAEDSY